MLQRNKKYFIHAASEPEDAQTAYSAKKEKLETNLHRH